MKRFALLAFAFIWLAACETPSAPTLQTPSVDVPSFALIANDKFDISGTLFNPCPPTEAVAFEGSLHQLVTGDTTPTGFDLKFHQNAQGIEGVGLTSGDRYRVLSNVKSDVEVSFTPFQFEQEFDNRFRLIRQGSDDNLWIRFTFRVSFPPFQFEIIRQEIECRG